MAYVEIKKLDDCLANQAQRRAIANFACDMVCADLLLWFGVAAYKKAPTKKKALMLWDVFCHADSGKCEYQVNAAPVVAKGSTLQVKIAELQALRNAALQMGFLRRVTSSSARVPPATLFDELQRAVNHQGMLSGDFLRTYTGYKGKSNLPAAIGAQYKKAVAAEFKDAGFTLADVGLDI